jgi:uncharacterized protein
MKDLIGSTWQNLECERLGLTIKEHSQLVEAASQVATATGCPLVDAYQNAINAMDQLSQSANRAATFCSSNEPQD